MLHVFSLLTISSKQDEEEEKKKKKERKKKRRGEEEVLTLSRKDRMVAFKTREHNYV